MVVFFSLVSPVKAAVTELGVSKPITATSSISNNFPVSNMNDGNQSTYWESNPNSWPQEVTIDLGSTYSISKIILKLPSNWGMRQESIAILASTNNTTYTNISPTTSYSLGSSDATITFNATLQRYIRLQISSNNQAPAAQLSEFQIFGNASLSTPTPYPVPTLTPIPTITPKPTTTPTLKPIPTSPPQPTSTPTPVPSVNPSWTIRSVDVMKYSKDVVCNPPSDTFIATQVQKAKELGANYIAISTPYNNPSCGDSLALTKKWVAAIRAQGLSVWHRHMGLSFEGLYGIPKKYNDDYLQLISNYIIENKDLFKDGDIFTPTPEPDTAGIGGVTYCDKVCAFKDNAEFNQWIRNAQLVSKLSFAQIGLPNLKIGYYGTSGFIVVGENNPDWFGKSFLEPATVTAMDNVIAMDSYPESYGGNMKTVLDKAHEIWPNATFMIGEWGTISASNETIANEQIMSTMSSAKRSYVSGFNYWTMGPSGQEGLLNTDGSIKSTFTNVQSFYTGKK